jgi:hypothetical protein
MAVFLRDTVSPLKTHLGQRPHAGAETALARFSQTIANVAISKQPADVTNYCPVRSNSARAD